MTSSSSILVTIDASAIHQFAVPVPVNSKDISREKTIFHLISEGSGLALLGTYDQIMDFLAEAGQKMMSWPIISGRVDTFFVVRDAEQNGVSGYGRDGSESAEASGGDGSYEGAGGSSREA